MSSVSDLFIKYTDQIANAQYHADYIDLSDEDKHKVDEQAMQLVDNQIAKQIEWQFPHFKADLFDHYKDKLEQDELLRLENETAS